MELVLGSKHLSVEGQDEVRLLEGEDIVQQHTLNEIFQTELGRLAPYSQQVERVIVGFVELQDVDFFQFLPNVEDVWILSPAVRDISGLQHLERIRSLGIDRPTCRFDVLGELESLEEIYLDDWRPGADSLFRLRNLVKAGFQKYGLPNLGGLASWSHLRELWINAGNLEDLSGIPASITKLRLTNLRKLGSLQSISACSKLEELRLQGCRKVLSLDGLQSCHQLRTLSIAKGGQIETLDAVRNLGNLEYVFLADGTNLQETDIDALYTLPNLKELIIDRKSEIDVDQVHKKAPTCDVLLAS
jgi:hypothetical protein